MKRNYQKELDEILEKINRTEKKPTLLLHSCCAPCSSYVLEYLSQFFRITVFYYNPNIFPPIEYEKRSREQMKLIQSMDTKYPVEFIKAVYREQEFYNQVKDYEDTPEGGKRCFLCYQLRLRQTAQKGKELGFDYFTTTLSISPLKNAATINEIGEALAKEQDIRYLVSDFKKKNGYQRSVQLSKAYHLYRQDYCGCIFSQKEREAKREVNLEIK